MRDRIYVAIDLKSFYASVECVERGLDPLNTNLVVADNSKTDKTICLAVSPALKSFGVPGRPRLYEVVQKVNEVNRRRMYLCHKEMVNKSYYLDELTKDKSLKVDYIVAKPRMAFYMQYSTRIYNIYLKYISKEDIHVYSIDEVFMDVTAYLNTYQMTARELAMKIVKEVLKETGITATVGIGTNLYLAKIAMDIEAKHMQADNDGVRIAELDVKKYRENLWNHKPLSDFWRIGPGITKSLNDIGIYTMGDIAKCSINKEDLLYKKFGVGAELIIDHAWGIEPTLISDIKKCKPNTKTLGVGQVLTRPYTYEETKIIVKEMCDNLVLDLVEKKFVTDHIVLTIGYDIDNLKTDAQLSDKDIEIKADRYGRNVPKSGHGTIRLESKTSSTILLNEKTLELFERIADKDYLVRRVFLTFASLQVEKEVKETEKFQQFDLFSNVEEKIKKTDKTNIELKREKNLQEAIITIKHKYGKNALLKGTNLEKSATAKERNTMIGGHKG